MKLIIDIPKELYKDIQSRDWKNGELVFSDEWKAIHNGTPLDKLRAEIEEHAKINQNLNTDRARALCWCLEILDKCNVERSEE